MTTTGERLDRFRQHRHVVAMAALDTVPLLAARVDNILRAGRRITLVYSVGSLGPTNVTPGLHVYEDTRLTVSDTYAGYHVNLGPGLHGFGFGAYHHDDADAEYNVWARYHASPKLRVDMTMVKITGGLDNDGPARDDMIRIVRWNGEGVQVETVVAFDYGDTAGEADGGVKVVPAEAVTA